ncbi:murein biosynthesis integral membrane protein MurJ [Rhodoferax sp.]|uniref:murein biosynthesis integral membrane protein MurJ n=1 Tax=Rhodoferax sp. TaxID=50421 RepID=UPI002638197A|nr:murein biosynthesis integral membrane protein MurJ [Rhodoferax sp.]MDD4943634.1 murein biosynthesis integral membrane protein MurJ [Rhodoferax sp.]MDD5479484.1 murein biosynthesis integral membrane protein MurJ [Rhodoferax sp.]
MSLFKSASIVSLLTLLSRVTGLARELLIASTFGASAITDAFNVAFRIPNLFRRLFGEGAFSQAFIPVLAASKAQRGEEATRRLIDHVATVLAWALLGLSVLGVLGAGGLVWVMASGLQQDPRGFDVAVVLTRWMFPYIAFMSLVALGAGVLNTWKRFALPAATPVLLNICMIGAAWLGAPWFKSMGWEPIYALAGGVLLGGVLQLSMQWLGLKQLKLQPRLAWRWSALKLAWADSDTQKILRLMGPALLGVSVAHLSMLINTQIASHLAPGSVSWITYADRLMEFPTAMLGVALGVVLMPQLAGARASNDAAKYSAMLDWGLRLVVALSVPCAVALLVFPTPLVAVLYHYGAMTEVDVRMVTYALMGWGVGLVGLVALKVLAPGYYANQDTQTPVKVAVLVLVVTQILNVFLVPVFAHAALTLSIGIGAMVNALWLLLGLLKRGSYKPLAGWGVFGLQVLAASALLAVFLTWANSSVDWVGLRVESFKRIWLLALVLIASVAIYFVALMATGLKLKQLIRR